MDKTLEQKKAWAVSRLRYFLGKLEVTTDALDAETQLYTIMRTAEAGYETFMNANKGVL